MDSARVVSRRRPDIPLGPYLVFYLEANGTWLFSDDHRTREAAEVDAEAWVDEAEGVIESIVVEIAQQQGEGE